MSMRLVVMNHMPLILNASGDTSGVKPLEKTLNGRTYYVLPSVMLTEGVHAGSAGPLFYSAAELEASTPLWNSMPAVINHPAGEDGSEVSARQPDVIEKWGIGYVYNAKFVAESDSGPAKLLCETWIDKQLIKARHPVMAKKIAKGETVEISTGLFCEIDETPGTYKNVEYVGSVQNIAADHLAFLPDSVGACSMTAGCGAGAKQVTNSAECQCKKKAPEAFETAISNAHAALKAKLTAGTQSGMISNAASMTVDSLMDQLYAWVSAKYRITGADGHTSQWAYLCDVDFLQGLFVFKVETAGTLQHWQSSYTIADGVVTVSADPPVQVTAQKVYTAVTNPISPPPVTNEESSNMSTSQTPAAIPAAAPVQNNAPGSPQVAPAQVAPIQYQPQAQPFPVQYVPYGVQNGYAPQYAPQFAQPFPQPQFVPAPGAVPYAAPAPAVQNAAPAAPAAPAPVANASQTVGEFFATAPDHLKPVTNALMGILTNQRQDAIATVLNSAGNTMTADQLAKMDHAMLMQISNMVKGVSAQNQSAAPAMDPFTGQPILNAGSSYAGAVGTPPGLGMIGNAGQVEDLAAPSWADIVGTAK